MEKFGTEYVTEEQYSICSKLYTEGVSKELIIIALRVIPTFDPKEKAVQAIEMYRALNAAADK